MPRKTCSITQPEASGNKQVCSSNSLLPKVGRQTKTSLKASRPATPVRSWSESECVPVCTPPFNSASNLSDILGSAASPTHPNQLSPVYSLPIFPFPTISQLNDFPNLTAPSSEVQRSVIVTLPNSAPVSPAHSVHTVTNSQPNTPVSSIDVSVILSNPGFIPQPPAVPSRFSTPTGASNTSPFVGYWDNFLEEPTYKDQEFWGTRKINLVSTDVSDVEDFDVLDNSQARLQNLEIARIEHTD